MDGAKMHSSEIERLNFHLDAERKLSSALTVSEQLPCLPLGHEQRTTTTPPTSVLSFFLVDKQEKQKICRQAVAVISVIRRGCLNLEQAMTSMRTRVHL